MFTPPSQAGRLAVVTGTGGLGYEVAKVLARSGARVILAGRNERKGREAVARLTAAAPRTSAEFEQLDLASLQSVRDFGARMSVRREAIDILVNNAGIMSPPRREITAEGHELQFGVNYLGHFALTAELLRLLRASRRARVVTVTSLAQRHAKAFDPDDFQADPVYQAGRAYCLSKLLQAMFAIELQRRSEAGRWGIASIAAHPGFAGTGLFETGGSFASFVSSRIAVPLIGQSAANGALPLLFAATSPDAGGGRLYGPKGLMEMRGPPGECAFADKALDSGAARKLWALSEDLIGRSFASDASCASSLGTPDRGIAVQRA